jgi:hypothetical protein
MVRVGVGIAGRSGIEMASGRRERRFTLADGMQMDPVHPFLESRQRHGDRDDFPGALLALDEVCGAGDALALDVGVRPHDAGAGCGLLLRRRGTACSQHRRKYDQWMSHGCPSAA